ncbi:MAG: IS4 family transposase [Deltaproteobacteria bacterium]|nr:IS4 family transposase [Deltaproteobacteria bacterium]
MIDQGAMAQAFRTFFEQTAETTARQTKFVIRRSKLTGAVFVETLVLGWSERPTASLNDLAETAADLDVAISAQGLDQRINEAAVKLFAALCQESLRWFQQRVPLAVAILRQFTAVEILDSSCIALPATLKETYPGSGGDGPVACLKVQLLLNFLTGELEQVVFQTGCDPDQAYDADLSTLRPGVLRLTDLGYFKLERFQTTAAQQAYFLPRLDLQVGLRDATTTAPVDLLAWLQSETASLSERDLLVGNTHRLPCRIIAVRLPQEVVDRRRQRATANARRKGRSTPTARYLALLAWNIYMTNVPATLLSAEQVALLYPVRWQVELVFKLWKSEFAVDRVAGLRRERVLCELYAKLIGAVLLCFLAAQHRLTTAAELSLVKATHILRRHVLRIAQRLAAGDLEGALTELDQRLQRLGGKTKRRKTPSTLRQLERLVPPNQLQPAGA